MRIKSTAAWNHLEPREDLDVTKLQAGVRDDVRLLRPWLDQMTANTRTRECKWDGQSPDGRKRKAALGKDALPWEGASDARLPIADEVINESKLVMTSALRAAKMEVKGTNSGNDATAALITPVMNYVLHSQLAREAVDEPELMADYCLEHGTGFMRVGWLTMRDIEEKDITVEELLGFALQISSPEVSNQGAAVGEQSQTEASVPGEGVDQGAQADVEERLWEMLLDPAMRAQLIDLLMQFDPTMTKAEAGRVANAMKRGQPASYFRPYVRESRPTWEALALGVDLTVSPAAMRDIQRAPRVTVWHWLTQAQLNDLASLEKWNEEVLATVVNNPGAMWQDWNQNDMPGWVLGAMGVGQVWTHEATKTAGLYHIAETFHRASTKAGPSVLYRTVHHGSVSGKALKHEVVKDKHGKIPVVAMRRQVRSKLLVQSKGIAQEALSWQSSIKLHHDAQDDNTVLRTTPPMLVGLGALKRFHSGGVLGANGTEVGPWAKLPVGSTPMDKFEFMPMPGSPVDSARIQEGLRSQTRRYFGLADPTVPPPVTQMHQQKLAATFLQTLGEAMVMTLQLCQQYMDPIVGAEVAGMAGSLHADREAIQGNWQMLLTFDVKDLDLDWLVKKFDLLAKMLQFDSGGFVKRGELMKYVFAAADPVLAQRLVIDDTGAADAYSQDEKGVISALVAGQKVRGRLESPMTRLAAHEEWLQNPESLQQLHARPSLLQQEIARIKTLEFNQEQQTSNATTGRTGEPAQAPWEEGQKLSERLEAMFGIGPPKPSGAQQPMAMAA